MLTTTFSERCRGNKGRLVPAAAHRLISSNFPHTRLLGPERSAALLAELGDRRIGGGSVYDALVGATAVEHGLTLVSRHRRALETYRALGAAAEVVD